MRDHRPTADHAPEAAPGHGRVARLEAEEPLSDLGLTAVGAAAIAGLPRQAAAGGATPPRAGSYLTPHRLIALQRSAGNRAIASLLTRAHPAPRPAALRAVPTDEPASVDRLNAAPVSPAAASIPADQSSGGPSASAELSLSSVGGAVVQRDGWTNPIATLKDDATLIEDGLKGDVEAIKHISHYDSAIDAAKLKLIKILLDNGGVWGRNAYALEGLWGAFGDRLPTIAGANIDLWKQSVTADKDLRNIPAVKTVPTAFITDVANTARKYLKDNEETVNKEVGQLGGDEKDEAKGEGTPETRTKVADLQEGAKRLTRAREAMLGLEMLQVGTEITGEGGVDETTPLTFKQVFMEGGPPAPETNGGKKKYDIERFTEIMPNYAMAQAAVNGLLTKYPALVGLEGGGADPQAAAALSTSDPDAARATVLAALHRTREHITDTRDRLGGDLPYELHPIHDELLSGKLKTTTDWTNPFNKAIAQATVQAYDDHQFWVDLGLSTLAAAAFVVAEIATGGMATFFVGFAVGIGVGQAAEKWQKAQALSNAAQASLDPNAQLVASGQAEAAGVDALLSTVFAFIDIKMAAGALAKIGKLAELAKIGGMTVENAKPLIEKAIAEYGVEATAKSTGKTAAELLEIVGKDSPAASRLRTVAEAARVAPALEKPTELGAVAAKAAKTKGMGLLWTVMTREMRAAKLIEIVNERLAAAKIPLVKGFKWSGTAGAFFDFEDWKIALNEAVLKAWVHSDADFAKLIETAYHEARHSEQWFEMARYRAATMQPYENPATLAKQMSIPQDIFDAAAKQPMVFGSAEFQRASDLFKGIYSVAGKAARNKVLDDLKEWTARLAADEAAAVSLKKSGASAADIAKAQAKAAATRVDYDAAYAAYKALPEEVDAWKVGEDAAAAFLKAQTK
jgi:hypothetical protein